VSEIKSDAGADPESALLGLYDRYFTVVPADTEELLDAAHALRYQVYCVEHAFEDPAQQVGERENDRYDANSVHAVLIYKPSGQVVGCVRLILPEAGTGISRLPIRDLLNEDSLVQLDQYEPARTGEISRYAVSKMFRRRQDEEFFADMHMTDLPSNDARRLVPHVSLGLIRGVGTLAAHHGITTLSAAMAPALLRLLERFGLVFTRLGPVVDYHGPRQPCVADCEALLAGMATRHAAHFQLVEAAYRGTSVGGRAAGGNSVP
jgi:N-acyl amino acid synthase of PEP-CTERM/exosortase system